VEDDPDGAEDRDEQLVTVLAFAPDGSRLAAGMSTHMEKVGIYCRTQLWDIAPKTRNPLARLVTWFGGRAPWKRRTFAGVSHFAFSPDGKTLATNRGQISAWSATEAEVAELKTVRLWSVREA
jgi:WD40 repeat protein